MSHLGEPRGGQTVVNIWILTPVVQGNQAHIHPQQRLVAKSSWNPGLTTPHYPSTQLGAECAYVISRMIDTNEVIYMFQSRHTQPISMERPSHEQHTMDEVRSCLGFVRGKLQEVLLSAMGHCRVAGNELGKMSQLRGTCEIVSLMSICKIRNETWGVS